MPRDDIGRTAFAVVVEGDFDARLPTGATERAHHVLDERRVTGVEEAPVVACPPPRIDRDPDIEWARDLPERHERDGVESAVLDVRDRRPAQARRIRQIDLSPGLAYADLTDDAADASIVHRPILTSAA